MHNLFRLMFLLIGVTFVAIGGCRSSSPQPADKSDNDHVEVVADHLERLDLKGRVGLIEFGSRGCELSDKGLAEMVRVARRGEVPHVTFARVEVGSDAEAFEAYLSEVSPPFAMVHDVDAQMAKAFDAMVVPTFVLVDKFGNIRYRGPFPARMLDEWVEVLVAETVDLGPDALMFGEVELDARNLLAGTRVLELGAEGVKTLAEYKGSGGLVLVFVDTACPYAGQAIDDLPSVAATLGFRDVPVVAVNIDDVAEDVKEFYYAKDLGVPVVYDVTAATRLAWNITSVPTVVYIDPADDISYRGKALWEDLAAAVGETLKLTVDAVQFEPVGTGYG